MSINTDSLATAVKLFVVGQLPVVIDRFLTAYERSVDNASKPRVLLNLNAEKYSIEDDLERALEAIKQNTKTTNVGSERY